MRTKRIQVGNCNVHVVDEGTGTPTLFLHGNPDSSEIWQDILPLLVPLGRCIAPDLPGFGRSDAPDDFDCSLDGMAAFVEGLVTALGVHEPLNLVVHDIGGPYGLAWAVRYPHKVRSMTIMNTVFFPDYRWHRMGRLWRMPVVGELVQALTTRRGFVRELRRGSRRLTDARIHRTYDLVTAATKRMVLRWYRATDPRNFAGWEERLLELAARVPTLVLWGEHDPYIPARYAERFGTTNVELFAGIGHWLPAEAPKEVADRLLRFLHGAAAAETGAPGLSAPAPTTAST
ncbi:MAG: Alpha-beta hydrolase [Ramlibacter sp.]|nr:Alpha-beta hydrolase [Ramlibacter sp.]